MKLKQILIIVIILLIGKRVAGQDYQEKDKQVWADYFLYYSINTKYRIYSQVGYKNLITNGNWQQFMLRTSFNYTLNNTFVIHSGLLSSYTCSDEDFSVVELRPWQGMMVCWPEISRINFQHFGRIEERLFFLDTENRPFTFRLRIQTGARIPLNKPELEDKTWYIYPYYEFFTGLHAGEVNFTTHVSRYNFSLGYRFNKRWTAELVCMQNRARNTWHEDFEFRDYVFRALVRNYYFRNGND